MYSAKNRTEISAEMLDVAGQQKVCFGGNGTCKDGTVLVRQSNPRQLILYSRVDPQSIRDDFYLFNQVSQSRLLIFLIQVGDRFLRCVQRCDQSNSRQFP